MDGTIRRARSNCQVFSPPANLATNWPIMMLQANHQYRKNWWWSLKGKTKRWMLLKYSVMLVTDRAKPVTPILDDNQMPPINMKNNHVDDTLRMRTNWILVLDSAANSTTPATKPKRSVSLMPSM